MGKDVTTDKHIPLGIENIIFEYTNIKREIYLDELEAKTRDINDIYATYVDIGRTLLGICNFRGIWSIRSTIVMKYELVIDLNKRSNKRNELFGIIKTDIYGSKAASNLLFLNY